MADADSLAERLRGTLVLASDSPPMLTDATVVAANLASQCTLLSRLTLLDLASPEGVQLQEALVGSARALAAMLAARAHGGCRAYRDALHAWRKQVVEACAMLAALLAKQAPPSAVAAALSAATGALATLGRLPSDGRVATGRALVTAGVAVKDAARELLAMVPTHPHEEGEEARVALSDSESCDYQEEATSAELEVLRASGPLLDASLGLLQPLLRLLSSAPEARACAATLDGVLEAFRAVAAQVEAFTAALWPPQENALLRLHGAALAAAAQAVPAAALALRGQVENGGAGEEHWGALTVAVAALSDAHGACSVAVDASERGAE